MTTIPPTAQRKSQWYTITGHITITSIMDTPGQTFHNPTASVTFQPDGHPRPITIVPPEKPDNYRRYTRKVLDTIGPMPDETCTWDGPTTLHLRHITHAPTPPKTRPTQQWKILYTTPDGTTDLYFLAQYAATKAYARARIKHLQPHATPIPWPKQFPNDEPPTPNPPANEPTDKIWKALKTALTTVTPLNPDQIIPTLEIQDIGMDSLDGVELIMELQELLDIYIPDESYEPLLGQNNTLAQAHQYLTQFHKDYIQNDQ